MRDVCDLEVERGRSLRGLLFDLDDTFLNEGHLEPGAFFALGAMRDAGLRLVVVTGRPIGWARILARQWPVDGVVSENGAIAAYLDEGKLHVLDPLPSQQRSQRREHLDALIQKMHRRFAGLRAAEDAPLRVSDYTFDIGEYEHPPTSLVEEAVGFARAAGARTTCSSVHLHVTYDGDDKASGALRFLKRRFGEDPSAALSCYAFIGDSSNDASCFSAFDVTIGVSNLSGRFSLPPRFSTRAARASGFAEAAGTLIGLRQR